jgi:hypothetical protein
LLSRLLYTAPERTVAGFSSSAPIGRSRRLDRRLHGPGGTTAGHERTSGLGVGRGRTAARDSRRAHLYAEEGTELIAVELDEAVAGTESVVVNPAVDDVIVED